MFLFSWIGERQTNDSSHEQVCVRDLSSSSGGGGLLMLLLSAFAAECPLQVGDCPATYRYRWHELKIR